MHRKLWLSAALAATLLSAGFGFTDAALSKSGTDYTDTELRTIAAAGDKQKFLQAVEQFLAVNPNDADRLAHAAALADAAGANLTAIRMYDDFIKKFPSDARAERVRKLVKRLHEEEDDCPEAFMDATPDQDFYLVDTIRKHVVRWKPARLPLKVCVRASSAADAIPAEFLQMSKQTFQDWSTASGNTLKFAFVSSPDAADIDVMWTKDRSKLALPGKQGVTSFQWKDGGVNKSIIVCLSIGFLNDDRISLKSAKHVTIHEVGHALGLGHSKNIHDAMYFADMTPDDEPKIGSRDQSMLQRLYSNTNDQLENDALAIATKYGAPEQTMIVSMFQDWAELAATQKDFVRAEKLLRQSKDIIDRHKDSIDQKIVFQNTRDLARALRSQEKWAEAAPYYQVCADALRANHADDDDLLTVLENLSACQRYGKLYQDCKKTCLETLSLLEKKKSGSEQAATMCLELGTLSYNAREFPDAEQYYKRAADIYARLKINNANSKLAQDNRQIAADYMKGDMFKDKVEQPFCGKGDINDWYAANELYKEAGRLQNAEKYDAAVAKYREAIAKYADDGAYYLALGNTLLRQKKPADAAVAYAKAVELNPGCFTAAYWYGISTYQERKLSVAKDAFLKAVAISHTPEQKQDVQKYLDNINTMIGSTGE